MSDYGSPPIIPPARSAGDPPAVSRTTRPHETCSQGWLRYCSRGGCATEPDFFNSPFRVAIHLWLFLIMALASFLIGAPAAWAGQLIAVNDINISLGAVGEAEFIDGYALVPAHPIFWESEIPWRITVSSLDPNLGMSDDGSYIKPLDDLLWKLSDEQSWMPMTQEAEEVDWSADAGEGVVYVDFVVLLAWLKDVPGQYGTELVFTIEGL